MIVIRALILIYVVHICIAHPPYNLVLKFPTKSMSKSEKHRLLSCSLAGAISCSLTHSIFVPLDAVKTRIQAFGSHGQQRTWQLLLDVVKSGGFSALFTGLVPTASGYFLQGAVKFGCYDLFKHRAAQLTGRPVGCQTVSTLLLCGAAAEVLASVALCPLE
ncbi:solute carrier family 25 protein, partial [archaeon]